jgi:Putative peptidoglycan binding domain
MKMKRAISCATAASLALVFATSYAADDTTTTSNQPSTNAKSSESMTGKQKATAIGAGTGAVAGAVVGGPVGAVIGAGIGGYVGHEGTDANGKVSSTSTSSASASSDTVRNAQVALNTQGYNAGPTDGQFGPNTQGAVRRFQNDRGLAQTGTLDGSTLSALGVSR